MKNLKVKNLDITFSDHITEAQIEETINRCFVAVDFANTEPVYLVKIKVGDMRMDRVASCIKFIKDKLDFYGVTNYIVVPLCKNGIHDITVEKIEILHEKV